MSVKLTATLNICAFVTIEVNQDKTLHSNAHTCHHLTLPNVKPHSFHLQCVTRCNVRPSKKETWFFGDGCHILDYVICKTKLSMS